MKTLNWFLVDRWLRDFLVLSLKLIFILTTDVSTFLKTFGGAFCGIFVSLIWARKSCNFVLISQKEVKRDRKWHLAVEISHVNIHPLIESSSRNTLAPENFKTSKAERSGRFKKAVLPQKNASFPRVHTAFDDCSSVEIGIHQFGNNRRDKLRY